MRWVDWHPTKGVIASCSKDACVKLWDPRAAAAGCLSTLHGHKNGVFQARVRGRGRGDGGRKGPGAAAWGSRQRHAAGKQGFAFSGINIACSQLNTI